MRNIGTIGVLAVVLATMLGACAGPGGSETGSRSTGTGKVEAYGVIDGGVTVVR